MVPVPAPVFGPLLEEIDDLAELKCTLRVIWALSQKKGFPRYVTLREMLADRTLASALSKAGTPDHAEVSRALNRAVERGTLATGSLRQNERWEQLYSLNTEADRAALAKIVEGEVLAGKMSGALPWEADTEQPNIYALYERNIGVLSPIIADQLREAEELYPETWIEDAIREAVEQNKRSWRYISRILERWDREGKGDGKPGRYSQTARRY
jgi:DnaD/phage-associated family protein